MREGLTQIPVFVSILPHSRCAEDDFRAVHWRAALRPLLGAAPGCAAHHSSPGHLHRWWVCSRSAPGGWGVGTLGESSVELAWRWFDKLMFKGSPPEGGGAQEQTPLGSYRAQSQGMLGQGSQALHGVVGVSCVRPGVGLMILGDPSSGCSGILQNLNEIPPLSIPIRIF